MKKSIFKRWLFLLIAVIAAVGLFAACTDDDTATPTPTPTPTPEPEADVFDYVLNTNTMKFHYQSCSSVEDIKEHNKGFHTGTRDEVISMGYSPCGRCKP